MHSVTMPRWMPSRRIEWSSRVVSTRAGGADRMAVRDRAAFDIDDVLGKPELAHDGEGDRGEGFVDLDALDVADRPAGALSAWRTAGTGPRPNMPGSTAPTP